MKTKTALVTGASSGIGDATVERFAMAGLGNILAPQRTAFLRDGSMDRPRFHSAWPI